MQFHLVHVKISAYCKYRQLCQQVPLLTQTNIDTCSVKLSACGRVQNNVRQSAIFRAKIATNRSKTLMSGYRCLTRILYFITIKGKLQAAETNLQAAADVSM